MTNKDKPVGPRVIPIGNTIMDMAIPTITSTSTAYTSGDAVGGLMAFNAVDDIAKTGVLAGVTIIDTSRASANLELHLFSTSFAAATDNAAWNPSISSLTSSYMGFVSISSTNYATSSSAAVASVNNIGLPIVMPNVQTGSNALLFASTTMYGQLVVRTSTPTYLSVTPLVVKIRVLSD